jgi:ribonucleoside-diphosphate reductase alpha chain
MRNQAGVMMPDVNEDFVRIAKEEGWYSEELVQRIAQSGTAKHPEVPEKWQRVFVTANEISADWHIRMQAAFQEYCDSAISKTTNFAHTASMDDVRAIYELAYELRCKGVTVYRDGSRDNQVLSTGKTEAAAKARSGVHAESRVPTGAAGAAENRAERERVAELQGTVAELTAELEAMRQRLIEAETENTQRRQKRARNDKLRGTTYKKETPLGVMFVTINEDDKGQPFEVFVTLGKAGGSAMADAEAMGRLISLALRSGIPLQSIHKQLRGISSDRAVGLGPNKVLSVPDAIGIALDDWWRERVQGVQQDAFTTSEFRAPGAPSADEPPVVTVSASLPAEKSGAQLEAEMGRYDNGETFMGTCPDCGSQLEYAEGCVKCHVCGFSECG